MGSRDAKAYLASPEVVAASALSGKISGPGWYKKPQGVSGVIRGEGEGNPAEPMSVEKMLEQIIAQADTIIHGAEQSGLGSPSGAEAAAPPTVIDILPGFPAETSGEILFCDADNVDADGIYPGKYTYQDGLTPTQMAAVCMENYDPSFRDTARAGDILVSGFNFGSGSSRKQAATALVARGVGLVVAGSFSNIFARNSVNNALLGLEVPRLVERLREVFGGDGKGRVLTRRTGWWVEWDVGRCEVTIGEGGGKEWRQQVGAVGSGVQEIVARGGLEGWVRGEIGKGS